MGGRRELEPLSVAVDRVAADGVGVGWAPGGTEVRLPGVLPQEAVDAEIIHVRRDRVHFGRVARVTRAARSRIAPGCRHFLRCGGCDFLHADMAWQRPWKRARVADALGLPLAAVSPTAASPDDLHYRHLIKLVVGPNGVLGSYAPRSHDVVDMRGCVVHAKAGEAIADDVRRCMRDRSDLRLRYVVIRISRTEGRAVVTLITRSDDRPTVAPLVQRLSARPEVGQVRVHINDSDGDALFARDGDDVVYDDGQPVVERIGSIGQHLASGAFAQVNPAAAAVLYDRVVAGLQPQGEPVADLYAGSGGIALTLLTEGAGHVFAVESNRAAAAAARASGNAAGWGARLSVTANTVENALPDLPDLDRIVVNPPRKGLSETTAGLLAARRWRRLVYVSCNPDSLARDVARLGGEVASVVPVDLFPQTRHIETVLTIVRSKA